MPRRGPGSGYAGQVPAVGQPADRSYGEEPAYRAEPAYRVDPALPAQPYRGQPGPPPYPAVPEPRRPEPVESRYTLLTTATGTPGHRWSPGTPCWTTVATSRTRRRRRRRVAPPSPPPQAAPVPAVAPVTSPAVAPPATVRPSRTDRMAGQSAGSDLERAAAVLRRDLGTPRVIAFANPKGGVHKTTATVLAAATVGSVRGRGVLAWDDNELRGTLGLRAGSARHARTIRHLVADLVQIEIREGAELLEILDDYLRHASDGSYDVLAGEESPRFAQRLDQFTVKRVLELLRRTHDVICVDTGNNVESPNWRTVMQAADQLVVTTVPREDAAFSADWMLDLLHEEGMGELADNAVTLISCPTPGRLPLQNDLEKHFATRTRTVTVVPYDPALETGSSIEYHQLQGETRQAWLRAASAMLEPFGR
ncbi:MinD/ParA family ATP-binding protein [Verrucosispora sioxanthis]|uniref:MinD/ParA family ATP-binding protein n=1 Tax=Verrucosispora sioxanthis TaxID=2499994 RepID=UPI001F2A87CE|nr:AAA family ATPase [Verrucosispora sioxanthis]